MSCNQYQITNYNNIQEGYYKWTGCTGIISVSQVNPLQTDFVCADDLTQEDYGAPLTINNIGLCPSNTPQPIYIQNLRTGGWYQNVCESVNSFANPTNVTVYSIKPFTQLIVGDHVYGNRELTIPPVNANFTISDGGRFIQISGTLIINQGVC